MIKVICECGLFSSLCLLVPPCLLTDLITNTAANWGTGRKPVRSVDVPDEGMVHIRGCTGQLCSVSSSAWGPCDGKGHRWLCCQLLWHSKRASNKLCIDFKVSFYKWHRPLQLTFPWSKHTTPNFYVDRHMQGSPMCLEIPKVMANHTGKCFWRNRSQRWDFF